MSTLHTLPADLQKRAQRFAAQYDMAPEALVANAVEEYLDRAELRQAFLQEAKEAWEDYERTGLHVAQDEMKDWLNRLKDNPSAEPPACHV